MRQTRIACLGLSMLLVLRGAGFTAADKPAAKLERIPAHPRLLQAPDGVDGDFDVAKTPPELDFAVYPGQWDGARLWSSWGDSLFASDGNFYASIGDHDAPRGTAYVYRIDPDDKSVTQVVDYNAIVKVPEGQYTPGKIHGALVEGPDGWISFFGYRGSVRRTTAEAKYKGDWLLRYRLQDGETKNLGIAVPYSSVPVLAHVGEHSLYGLSVAGQTMPDPSAQFFHYDLAKRKLVTAERIDSRGPRAMIVADDGRAWFHGGDPKSGDGRLSRYDPKSGKVGATKASVPGDGMLRAASRPDKSGIAYCFSRDGVIFAFDTNTESVKPFGKAFVGEKQYITTCRLDPSERYVYYIPGAHGKSSRVGTALIQFDVKTKRRKVIAFLNEHLRKTKNYNLGGTYGIALNADGSELFVNWNGLKLPGERNIDFGLCSAMIVHIPESERR